MDGAAIELVEIFTDGACSGNPGPGGFGALLRWGGKERELWGGEPDTTCRRQRPVASAATRRARTRDGQLGHQA